MTTTLVRTRHATTHDVEPLVALHRRCSPTTLRRRFHVPVADVAPRLVAQLVAPVDGWSILAERRDDVVALGCAGPLAPGVVEVGLLVEDAHQGTGIGARLTSELAHEAVLRGYGRMVCLAEPDNDAVAATVRRAGLDAVIARRDGVLEVSVALPSRQRPLRRTA